MFGCVLMPSLEGFGLIGLRGFLQFLYRVFGTCPWSQFMSLGLCYLLGLSSALGQSIPAQLILR